MNSVDVILLMPLLIFGASISILLLRKCIYHFAFYGMSKTRKRKIRNEMKTKDKILLFYTLKYRNRGMTRWCIICYYIFSVCVISTIILTVIIAFMHLSFNSILQNPLTWTRLLSRLSFALGFFSLFIKAKES